MENFEQSKQNTIKEINKLLQGNLGAINPEYLNKHNDTLAILELYSQIDLMLDEIITKVELSYVSKLLGHLHRIVEREKKAILARLIVDYLTILKKESKKISKDLIVISDLGNSNVKAIERIDIK